MTQQIQEISAYGTRSFWLVVLSVLIPVARTYGFDLSMIGMDEGMLADAIMIALPVLFGVWAYIERLYGKKKLIFKTWLKEIQS
jgi:hypothetical protein